MSVEFDLDWFSRRHILSRNQNYWLRAWFSKNHQNLSLNEQDIDSKLHVDRRPRGLWIVCDCLSKMKALLSILSNRRDFIASVLMIIFFLNSKRPSFENSAKSSMLQESVSSNELDLRTAWGRLLIGRHWNRNPLFEVFQDKNGIVDKGTGSFVQNLGPVFHSQNFSFCWRSNQY